MVGPVWHCIEQQRVGKLHLAGPASLPLRRSCSSAAVGLVVGASERREFELIELVEYGAGAATVYESGPDLRCSTRVVRLTLERDVGVHSLIDRTPTRTYANQAFTGPMRKPRTLSV